MDFAQVLRELWLRRGWVVLGAAVAIVAALATGYRIDPLPPKLTKKSLAIGAADTQVLIDTPNSALTDLGLSFKPLAERAVVYARFMTSRPVRQAIAREVGLQEGQIVFTAPAIASQTREAKEPRSTERDNDLLGEQNRYRLDFATDPGLPTITISAQAPNVEDAKRLADAGAVGFRKYVEAVQGRQDVPPSRRVTVRQLGAADGGLVAKNVNVALAAVTFAAVLMAWCLLVLLGSSVARSWRQLEDKTPESEVPDGVR